jgi:hypothetical protein
VATFGVPAAAGIMTAAVLLGPGEERPIEGARVRGLIADGAQVCSLVVETIRHVDGGFVPAAHHPMTVTLSDADGPLCAWGGESDDTGLAQARGRFRRPARAGETLRLAVASHGRPQARAELVVAAQLPELEPPTWAVDGAVPLKVVLPGGQLVPELADLVLIEVKGPESPVPRLEVSATGADHDPPGDPETTCDDDSCTHAFTVRLTARAPAVRLEVSARSEGASGHWEGELPLVPGGLWLDREALVDGKLMVRSSVPREVVFVSRYTKEGRAWGTALLLTTDDTNFSHGSLALDEPLTEQVSTFSLSTEPSEPPSATTHWPALSVTMLGGTAPTLLADGLPRAVAIERARAARARWPIFGLVIAAGLFEVLYLLYRHRRAGEELDRNMTEALAAEALAVERGSLRTRTPLWWLSLITGGMAVIFFALAAVALFF